MSEQEIQSAIWHTYNSASEIMVPNYTPMNWWECDIFRVLKSGFVAEYEIKTSVADFKADFKKSHDQHGRIDDGDGRPKWGVVSSRQKHDMLAAGGHTQVLWQHGKPPERSFVPNYFAFVIPMDIEDAVRPLVPRYAGLLVKSSRYRVYIKIKPPRLHGEKPTNDWAAELAPTFYHRYWNLKTKAK